MSDSMVSECKKKNSQQRVSHYRKGITVKFHGGKGSSQLSVAGPQLKINMNELLIKKENLKGNSSR